MTTPNTKTTQHTPGPWMIVRLPSRINSQQHSNVEYGLCNVRVDTVAEAEANARLIAAAPELLEALRSVMNVLELPEPTPDEYGTTYTVTQRSGTIAKLKIEIRAAIAKAEGRS